MGSDWSCAITPSSCRAGAGTSCAAILAMRMTRSDQPQRSGLRRRKILTPSFVPGCPARALGRDVREFQIGLIDAAAVCGSDMADEKSRLSISRLSLTPVETAVSTSR